MPYAVEHRGKLVDVPFDVLPQSSITGRFPNDVVLKMDESRFHVSFGRHAVWVQGNGPYAVLSYCDGTITISRWAKVEDAIGAKRTIDGSGCGGGCVKVHVIIHFDPENGAARERARDRQLSGTAARGRAMIDQQNVFGEGGELCIERA